MNPYDYINSKEAIERKLDRLNRRDPRLRTWNEDAQIMKLRRQLDDIRISEEIEKEAQR